MSMRMVKKTQYIISPIFTKNKRNLNDDVKNK